MEQRDRYSEATLDMASHIGEKILAVLRHPDNQARVQSIIDPVISHIIQRVFPYILLSAILFLIMIILTIGTFWLVLRSGNGVTNSMISVGTAGALVQAASDAMKV
jgi:hypothetical protein